LGKNNDFEQGKTEYQRLFPLQQKKDELEAILKRLKETVPVLMPKIYDLWTELQFSAEEREPLWKVLDIPTQERDAFIQHCREARDYPVAYPIRSIEAVSQESLLLDEIYDISSSYLSLYVWS
jgi:hypothetical protein